MLRRSCFLLLSALLVTPARAEVKVSIDMQKHQLENGLTVITLEDHSVPKVTLMQFVRMGSRDEYQGITGMSHRLEHLVLKPSGGNAALYQELEKIGYSFGGHTFNDFTDYIMQVPTDQTELGVRVWASHLKGLNTSPEIFERERQVQLNEYHSAENNPEFQVTLRMHSLAYQSHPYQWRANGWFSDVASFSLEDTQKMYDRFYVPAMTLLIAAGDIRTPEFLQIVRKHYGDIPNRKPPALKYTEEVPQRGEIRQEYDGPGSPSLYLGYHVPRYADPDQPLVQMLGAYLTRGRSSALGSRLGAEIESASVLDIDLYRMDPALMVFRVELKRPDSHEIVLSRFDTVIEELKERPLGERDLQRTRNRAVTDYLSYILYPVWRLWSTGAKVHWIGQNFCLTGDMDFCNKRLNQYQSATAEDLRKAAVKYFARENRTVMKVGAKSAVR